MWSAPLRWSPRWRATRRGHDLELSAGADETFDVDGLTPTTVTAVLSWRSGRPEPADDEQRRLLDRLVELGALVPEAPVRHGPVITTGGAAADRLAAELEGTPPPTSAVDCVLVVRTAEEWPDAPADRLHLGVDLSLHHHVVLGPLVIPGVSTCLRCLATRQRIRWGRSPVSAEPAITAHLPVVAHLVGIQLDLLAAGRSSLVNATIAWDLEQGTCDRQSVYKVPECAWCDHTQPGTVTLPGRP